MQGNLDDPDKHGLIPRTAQAFLDALEKSDAEGQISCSYLEIHNEELRDLLDPNKNKKITILNAKNSIRCRDLSEKGIRNTKDVVSLMMLSAQNRQVAETRMNCKSSRSHCIFTFSVETTRKLPNESVLKSCGKLHLVDLAGSGKPLKIS